MKKQESEVRGMREREMEGVGKRFWNVAGLEIEIEIFG